MTDVKCKVSSCHYWGRGDICVADSIIVENTTGDPSFGKMEAGTLDITDTGISREGAGRSGVKQADRSEQTCCKTFRPKDNKNRH